MPKQFRFKARSQWKEVVWQAGQVVAEGEFPGGPQMAADLLRVGVVEEVKAEPTPETPAPVPA